MCARDRQVLKESRSELKQSPEDGCYIDGLFIEGAAFDMDKMTIVESKPKDLFTDMPAFWLIPAANRVAPTSGVYDCPVYKTLTRAGTSQLCASSYWCLSSLRFHSVVCVVFALPLSSLCRLCASSQ